MNDIATRRLAYAPADGPVLSDEATGGCGDRVLQLEDGRQICWREIGARDGRAVLALHGTPGSRLKYMAADAAAERLGLRMICVDRWGYGSTSLHPRPSLAAYADDMSEFADRLGIATFGVIGVSGGGPFAVAVAARLGARVTALALAAPVGELAGERPVRDMRVFHWSSFKVLPRIPFAVRLTFEIYRTMLALSPRMAVMVASARAKGADRALIAEPDVRDRLAATFAVGLKSGSGGAVTDMQLFSKAWDVAPANVTAATRVWLGTADCNVPLSAARNLAKSIPRAELTELNGHGHFWLSRNYAQVLDWTAQHLDRRYRA